MLFSRPLACVAVVVSLSSLAACGGGSASMPSVASGGAMPGIAPAPSSPGSTPPAAPSTSPSATPSGAPSAGPSTAPASRVHDPVILIPGMTSPASEMLPMAVEFENAGWPSSRVFTWTDSTDMEGDLAVAAQELKGEVDTVTAQTGAQHVVLVTWSAAALAARYYIKNIDKSKVSIYVGMAGPQHGTTFNACQAYASCREFMAPDTPFMTALNAGTEVPGSPAIAYMTVRSDNDFNVAPEDSAMLAGANLNDRLTGLTAPDHFGYPVDATTFNHIKTFILEVEQGTEPR